jgi:phosphatidylserine synthase
VKRGKRFVEINSNTLLIFVTLLIILTLESYFRNSNAVLLLVIAVLTLFFIVFSLYSLKKYKEFKMAKLNTLNHYLTYPLLLLFGFLYNADIYPSEQLKIIVIALLFFFTLWNTKRIDLYFERNVNLHEEPN